MDETLLRHAESVLATAEDSTALLDMARSLHPADLALIVEELPEARRILVFQSLDGTTAAGLLGELDPETGADLLSRLPVDRSSAIVGEMATDSAADLLGEMNPEQVDAVLNALRQEDAAEIRELLDYDSDTAGGQMTTEFVAVQETLTVGAVIERLRALAPEAETVYHLYVVDGQDRLVGVVSLRSLIVSDPALSVSEVMSRDVISVPAEADQEEAADVIARYNLIAVPVVDESGRPIGIVTVDDAVDVIDEETHEDIYELAGSSEDPRNEPGLLTAIRSRLPRTFGVLGVSLLVGAILYALCPQTPAVLESSGKAGLFLVGHSGAGSKSWGRGMGFLAIVAFLPAMLSLSWLVQSRVRADRMGRLAAGGERSGGAWTGLSAELRSPLAIVIVSSALIAASVSLIVPSAFLALPLGVGLALGLAASVSGAAVFPRVLWSLRKSDSPTSGAAISLAHMLGLVVYLLVSWGLTRS